MAESDYSRYDDIAEERRIVLLGKLGAGKSHSGNGILGETKFKSEQSFNSVTKICHYGSATRNGLLYKIYDTPGIGSPDDLFKKVDVETDIKRCLYSTSPGFHAIVLVISGADRISAEDLKMLKKLDDLLGESAFRYMILVISKLSTDENVLNRLVSQSPDMAGLRYKCSERILSFGKNEDKVPDECVRKFDNILTNLIKENAHEGKEYYTHKYYERATRILEYDRDDYIKAYPEVNRDQALEIVRSRALEGKSPRDKELCNLRSRFCIIF